MAAGDYVVRTNTTLTTELPDAGSDLLLEYPTSVASNGSGISYSSGTFTLGETGRFLVMASNQWGTTDTTEQERTNSGQSFYLAGSQLQEGWASGYVRRAFGGSLEFIDQSIAFINVATTSGSGDELQVRTERIDDSTTDTVNRIADRSGISILKLDDTWNFAHYESSAAFTPSSTDHTRNTANIGSTVEEDGSVFSRSSNTVTITTSNPVLAIYTFQNDDTDTVSGRSEYQGVLNFDSSEVVASWNQTYGPRAQNNSDWGGMSTMAILYPDGNGQDLILNLVSREDADEDWFASLQLIELPSGAETAAVQRTTAAGDFNAADTDFAWQTARNVDTDAFTYTPGDANIDVDNDGDYLALANLGVIVDGGLSLSGDRQVPAISFEVNTTETNVAGHSAYNRGTGTANHAHSAIAGLLTGLSADDSVYVRASRLSTTTDSMASVGGFALVRLDSLFDSVTQTELIGSAAAKVEIGKEAGGAADGYVEFPGTSDFVSTSDKTQLDITSEFTIIGYIRADDYTPADDQTVLSKWDTGQRAFQFLIIQTSGRLQLGVSADGSAASFYTFDNSLTDNGISDGEGVWVRIHAGGSLMEADYSTAAITADPGSISWSQQSPDETPTLGSFFSGSADLIFGGNNTGTNNNFVGDIAYLALYDGEEGNGGTLVAEFDPRTGDWSSGGSDGLGNTYALGGDAVAVAGSLTFGTPLTVFQPLAGTLDASASLTASLTNTEPPVTTVELDAEISAIGSNSAEVDVQVSLSAELDVSASTSAGLDTTSQLSGSLSSVASASASMSAVSYLAGSLSAVASTSASLFESEYLNSTVSAVSSVSGSLSQVHGLNGSLPAAASASGSVSQVHQFATSLSVVASVSGALSVSALFELTGSTSTVGQVSGDLHQVHELVASPGTPTVGGANALPLMLDRKAVPTSWGSFGEGLIWPVAPFSEGTLSGLKAVSSITATLSTAATVSLSGSISAVAELSGSLYEVESLVADISSVASTSASISQVHNLSASVSAVASVSAAMAVAGRVLLDAELNSVASNTAELHQVHNPSSAVSAVASLSSSLHVTTQFAASLNSVASTSGSITQTHNFTASLSVVADTSASVTISGQNQFMASVSAVASTSAELHATSQLGATIGSVASTSAELHAITQLAAAISTVASSSAALAQITQLSSSLDAVASTSAELTVPGRSLLTGSISSVVSTSGSLAQVHELTLVASAVASSSATLQTTELIPLSGSASTVASTSGQLHLTVQSSGSVSAVAFLGGSLTVDVTNSLNATIDVSASTSAVLYLAYYIDGEMSGVASITAELTNTPRVLFGVVDLSTSGVGGSILSATLVSDSTPDAALVGSNSPDSTPVGATSQSSVGLGDVDLVESVR